MKITTDYELIELTFKNNDKEISLTWLDKEKQFLMAHPRGERMSVSEEEIFDVLDKFFRETF